jgi:hypothetical protein
MAAASTGATPESSTQAGSMLSIVRPGIIRGIYNNDLLEFAYREIKGNRTALTAPWSSHIKNMTRHGDVYDYACGLCAHFRTSTDINEAIKDLSKEEAKAPSACPIHYSFRFLETRIVADTDWSAFKQTISVHPKPDSGTEELFYKWLQAKTKYTISINKIVYFPENFIINKKQQIDQVEYERLYGFIDLANKMRSKPGCVELGLKMFVCTPAWISSSPEDRNSSKGSTDVYQHIAKELGGNSPPVEEHEDIALFANTIDRRTMVISFGPPLCVRDIIANMEPQRHPDVLVCDTIGKKEKVPRQKHDPNSDSLALFVRKYDRMPWREGYALYALRAGS